jgi:amino acid transporter
VPPASPPPAASTALPSTATAVAPTTDAPTAGAPAAADAGLVRALGPWALAAGIVNVTVGGGIFRLPASVAASLGAAAPLAYVVCAAAMGLIVLCFAEAGSRVALTGGPYAYVEVAFGPFVGFLGGVLLWLVGTFALAAVATLLVDALAGLLPAAIGAGVGPRTVLLALVLAALAAVNVAGVRQGARLNTAATVAKLVPLAVVIVAGAFLVRPEHLSLAAPAAGGPGGAPGGGLPGLGAVARSAVVLVFAFAGVESALVPSGEVREPARTVPRALALAMTGVTVLYLALQFVAQGVLGPALATSPTPLAAVAERAFGAPGRGFLLAGAAVSMFGYVSGMTLAVPRALFAFARDGVLPRALAAVHPRHRTPHVAIWVQTTVVFLLAASGTFERLAVLANVSTLVLYGACCVAAWALWRRDVRAPGAGAVRVPFHPAVPWLALAVIAGILTSVTGREWAVVLGVLAVAALGYLATGRGRRAAPPAAPSAAA